MWPAVAGGCVVLGVWWIVRVLPDAFVVPVFCRVPAEVAAQYYNAALQLPELAFAVRGLTVEVIRPCGATDFFSMVTGLFVYLCLCRENGSRRRSPSRLHFLAVLPLAWVFTIIANTIRIILLVPVKGWVYHHPFLGRIHLDDRLGTIVFLSLFMLLWEGVRRYVTRNKNAE